MAFTDTNKNHGNYYENKSFVKLSEPIVDCFDDTPVVRCLRSMVIIHVGNGQLLLAVNTLLDIMSKLHVVLIRLP